jgi:hypothetical protein
MRASQRLGRDDAVCIAFGNQDRNHLCLLDKSDKLYSPYRGLSNLSLPGSVITGSIQILDVPSNKDVIYFWAGLIHEDVSIDSFNNNVDPQQISIGY